MTSREDCRVQVDLTAEIEQVLHAKVAAGEYPTLAALVEEALFLLVERDWLAAQRDLRERAPAIFEASITPPPVPERS